MKEVMIVGATRTPIGSFAVHSPLSAVELGAVAVRRLLEESQLPAGEIDRPAVWSGADGRLWAKPGATDSNHIRFTCQRPGGHGESGLRRRVKSRATGGTSDPLR